MHGNGDSWRSLAVLRLAALLLLGLLLVGAAVLIVSPSLAEAFLFFPGRADPGEPPELAGVRGETVTVRTEDGLSLTSWWYPAPEGGPVVLLLHGNAGTIRERTPIARGLLERGVGVLLLEYRGYGGNEGKPTVEGIVRDARAGYGFVRDRAGGSDGVVLFGRSLGGAVAAQVARREAPGAVILESTFTSLRTMAEAAYPFLPSFVFTRLEGHLDTRAAVDDIRDLSVPMLVVHGARDDLIPPAMGRALHEAGGEGAAWLEVAGAGHNDVFLVGGKAYFDAVARFIREEVERGDSG